MKNESFHIEAIWSYLGFGHTILCTAINAVVNTLVVAAVVLSLGYWKFALACFCAALIIARLDWSRRRKLLKNLQHAQSQTMAVRLPYR